MEEEEIDVVDDLHVSGEKSLNQRHGPFLQRLGQDGMVGISKRRSHNLPCNIPLEIFDIDEDTLQLDDGERGMGIVQLNGDLIGELCPRTFSLFETTDNVVERRATPKVLLLQTEF